MSAADKEKSLVDIQTSTNRDDLHCAQRRALCDAHYPPTANPSTSSYRALAIHQQMSLQAKA